MSEAIAKAGCVDLVGARVTSTVTTSFNKLGLIQ